MYRPLRRSRRRRASTRRRRVYTRRRKRSRVATKRDVKRVANMCTEPKRVTKIEQITNPGSTDNLNVWCVGTDITEGVTPKGRIGFQIYLTGIQVRYNFQMSLTTGTALEPILHMYVVRMKNGYTTPTSRWFKAFDQGLTNPYEVLNDISMNEGTRFINTNDIRILGHKSVRLRSQNFGDNANTCGVFKVPLKRMQMTITHNGTGSPSPADISPPLYVVSYISIGNASQLTETVFQANLAISTYYRD